MEIKKHYQENNEISKLGKWTIEKFTRLLWGRTGNKERTVISTCVTAYPHSDMGNDDKYTHVEAVTGMREILQNSDKGDSSSTLIVQDTH